MEARFPEEGREPESARPSPRQIGGDPWRRRYRPARAVTFAGGTDAKPLIEARTLPCPEAEQGQAVGLTAA
jgi:hypothetical protein